MSNTVLVTGASQGIGRETAILLSKSGFTIHGTYLSHEQEAKMLSDEFGITMHKVDLSKAEDTLAFIDKIKDIPFDGLVNNAGIFEMEDWSKFLLSDDSSYIDGETIIVDGGLLGVDYTLKKESEG
jgi:NAD(P)-dependent dehydrogenase (short-subunit alcohol dehydrogenase family)